MATLALSGIANAATINWGSGGGRGNMFVATDGFTRLASGSLIQVGFYENPNDATSVFTLLGTTTIGDPGTGLNAIGGHLPSSGRALVGTAANGNTTFAGKQLAIVVYNSTTLALATQRGIFTSVAWTTPGGTGFDDSSDSVTFTVGASASPGFATPVISLDPDGLVGPNPSGSYSIGGVTVGGTTNNFGSIYRLGAIVPEPSGVVLLVMGLCVGMRRRR